MADQPSQLSPQQNPPVTAAGIVTAFNLVVAAFFTSLDQLQMAALSSVATIVAAFIVQRWFTDPKGIAG